MAKTAQLYRMMTPKHICPFGLKSKDLLERKGYQIEDHKLCSREETEAFKLDYEVKTTPQAFIDGDRIGGYDALREFFNMAPAKKEGTTYVPVIAIFFTAFLMASALTWNVVGTLASISLLLWFIGISMSILAIQKLQDLYAFSNQFITYDLLAMRNIRYAYVYPFAEAFAGIGMLGALPAMIVAPVSLFIGVIGGVSVFKAVYIDKRELRCACVGGNSKVPLGFVSLTENIFMIGGAILMLLIN